MQVASVRLLITWMRRLPRWLARRRFSLDERRAARLTLELVRCQWSLVALAFFANLIAAFFEGSTMGMLTVALQTLAGDEATNLAAALGSLGTIADNIQGSLGRDGLFLLLVVLAVISQVLRSGLQFGGVAAAAHLQVHVQGDVHARIFRQIMAMSYAQVSRYKVGDLTNYVGQASQMHALIHELNAILSTLLVMAAYVGVLLWLSWPMTLAALVVLALLSSSLQRIIRRVRRTAQQLMAASVELSKRTVEYLQGLRIVRTFAREDYAVESVESVLLESMVARRQGIIWQATIMPLMQSLTVIGVAVFLVAGYLLLGDEGRKTLPRLLTFLFVLYRLMPRVGLVNDNWARISSYMPAIERVAAILRTDDKQYTVDGGRPFAGLYQGIEFCNVSLLYIEGEQPAVKDLAFIIPRGSVIALVGESGGGKSTVADLLLRLYDPTAGQILVDGVDLCELDLKAWRDHMGVVSQDTFIFNASIRHNIAFGKLDASEEEIIAAAQAANAHDFIMELANGYDTVVGDRGYRLSGGQRQRITIARAILRDPEILVLDEATSDLDSQSERLIQEALDELRSERTVLAIAHRLSTIAMADQILVLERGRLVEQGIHEELLALDGCYARFWRLQSDSAGELEPAVVQHVDTAFGCDK